MIAEELRIVLAEWVANAGDQKRLAAKLDVSEQYLCDVLKGRREPGKKLLDGIGAERVVTYRMKDASGVPPSASKTEAAGGAEQTNTEKPDLTTPPSQAASDVKASSNDQGENHG